MAPETIISYDGVAVSGDTVDTSKYHLLFIDDDRFYLELAGSFLGREYRISVASSGEEGIQQARELLPDLILLDVEIPGMVGYETCRLFKHDRQLRHIPVLFITPKSEAGDEYRGLAVGAVDFLRKLLQPDVLHARITLQLRLKQLLAQEKVRQKKLEN